MRVPSHSDKDALQLSVRPYLLRAWYEWCVDQKFTPYITVFVDEQCRVPMQFVQKNSITLNLAPHAVVQLTIKEIISFHARFGGMSHEVMFPAGNATSVYALENQVGMAFSYVATKSNLSPPPSSSHPQLDPQSDAPLDAQLYSAPKPPRKGHLTLVK